MRSSWKTWTGFEWLVIPHYSMAVYDADTTEIIPEIELTREIFDASAESEAEGIILVDGFGELTHDREKGRRVYVGVV